MKLSPHIELQVFPDLRYPEWQVEHVTVGPVKVQVAQLLTKLQSSTQVVVCNTLFVEHVWQFVEEVQTSQLLIQLRQDVPER